MQGIKKVFGETPKYKYEPLEFTPPCKEMRELVWNVIALEIVDSRVEYSMALFCLYTTGLLGVAKNPIDLHYREEESLVRFLYSLNFKELRIGRTHVSQSKFVNFARTEFENRLGTKQRCYYQLEYDANTDDPYKNELTYWGNIPALQMQEATFLFGKPLHDYMRAAIVKRFEGSDLDNVRDVFRTSTYERLNNEWMNSDCSWGPATPKSPLDFDEYYYQWIMGVFQPMANNILYYLYEYLLEALGGKSLLKG